MGTLAPTIGVARVTHCAAAQESENENREGTKGSMSWSLVAWNAGRKLESNCTLASIKALMDSSEVVGVNESGYGNEELPLHGKKVIHAPRRDSNGHCLSSGGAFLAIKEEFARTFVFDNHDALVQFRPPPEVAVVMLRSECVGFDGPAVALVCPYVPPPGVRLSSEESMEGSSRMERITAWLSLLRAAGHEVIVIGDLNGHTGTRVPAFWNASEPKFAIILGPRHALTIAISEGRKSLHCARVVSCI